jgi:hypothetical protein
VALREVSDGRHPAVLAQRHAHRRRSRFLGSAPRPEPGRAGELKESAADSSQSRHFQREGGDVEVIRMQATVGVLLLYGPNATC